MTQRAGSPPARPQPPAPTPTVRTGLWAWLIEGYLLLRGGLLLASAGAVFVVVTALSGAWLEPGWARATAGVTAALLAPVLLRARLRRAVARRRCAAPLRGPWFLVACNLALLLAVGLGFSDAVGRSLRRRGDWFLGELDGPLPRRYRSLLVSLSGWLERFDLPPEAAPLLIEPANAQVERPELVDGSPLPRTVAPRWLHPLLGPRRALPPNAACRFGASRPGPRPAECELGHCGIDLVQPEGSPVHAVHEAVVLRVERNEAAGGIAGRFLILEHLGGAVRSSYVHLQEVRADLRPGVRVRPGEVVATLGRTGTRASGPHLHFAIAVRRGAGQLYIDPEPLIRRWDLPGPSGPLLAASGQQASAER